MGLARRITKVEDGPKVFRLKNILPSGHVFFHGTDEKDYDVGPDDEFEVNLTELEGFKERAMLKGYVIFMDIYEGHDEIAEYMPDKKIEEICELPLGEFSKVVDGMTTSYSLKRFKDILIKKEKPAGYAEHVNVRNEDLLQDFKESQEYETDVERNRRIYNTPNKR